MKTTNHRIFITLVSVFLLLQQAFSQSEPMYSQYMFNTLNINPGYAGSRNALSMYMLSRSQWVGIEGAPSSQSIAVHSPFFNEKTGVGASVTFDKIGPSRSSYINLNYSYKIRVTEKVRLALGIKGGITNHRINLSEIKINAADAAFAKDAKNSFLPNIGFGTYYYTDKYYIGVSIPKLFESRVVGKDIANYSAFDKESRHYFIMGGYVMSVSSMFKLKPTALIKIVEGAPASVDINANVLYGERLWFGIMYRFGDAIGALIQYKVSNQFALGYSYDMAVTKLNSHNTGTHEIMISLDFDLVSKYMKPKPRYF